MARLSVVTAVYNAENTVSHAIESALAQTYKDYEIVVVNDGSTDGTHDILQQYVDRIRYIRQENKGRSEARNTAIRHARGDWIAFLDSDDLWLETKLEKQVQLIDRRPDLGLVFAWADAFDTNGKIVRTLGTDYPRSTAEGMDAFEMILRSCPPMLTVVARKACIEQAGMFDRQVSAGEDRDLWLRIALRHKVGFVPEVLACYRLSGAYLPARVSAAQGQQTRPYVIGKVFDLAETLPERRFPSEMRDRALARAYFYAALIDYGVRNLRAAQASLEHAQEHDPSFFEGQGTELVCSMAEFALNLYDTWTPPEEARAFLGAVFGNLPSALQEMQRLKPSVYRTVAAGQGFRAWDQYQPAMARRLLLQAVLRYPTLGRNLGIWSICVKSLLGQRSNAQAQTIEWS